MGRILAPDVAHGAEEIALEDRVELVSGAIADFLDGELSLADEGFLLSFLFDDED